MMLVGMVILAAVVIGAVCLIARRRPGLPAPQEPQTLSSPACAGAWADGKAPEKDLTAPLAIPSKAKAELPAGVHLRTVGNGEAVINECIFDEVLHELDKIPPLPQAIVAILRELEDVGSSAKSIASIVATEPVLAATVLRVCNSAAMGLRRQIVKIDQAVAYLGFGIVKSIVLRMKLAELFPARRADVRGYDSEALWLHSLVTGQLADHLAKRVGGVDPWLASTIGLLHDIGKLAINGLFPQKVAMLWEKGEGGESFLGRERRIFGADHAKVGGYLAERWKLPKDLVNAVRLHHLPCEQAMTEIRPEVLRAIHVVHVANQLAKYGQVYCEDMEIDIIPPAVLESLALPANVEDLLDPQVQQVIEQSLNLAIEDTAKAAGA